MNKLLKRSSERDAIDWDAGASDPLRQILQSSSVVGLKLIEFALTLLEKKGFENRMKSFSKILTTTVSPNSERKIILRAAESRFFLY